MAAALAAQTSSIERLFPERPTGYVTDVAGIVDPESEAEIERLAARLREATGAELAVVTLPTIEPYDGQQVALQIGRKWGVGAKGVAGDPRRNAGVVFLVVPRQGNTRGHIRIETGNGIEGIVTDATAGRIRDAITPLLARGEYSQGILAGARSLAGTIARGFGVSDTTLTAYRPQAAPEGGGGRGIPGGGLLLLLLFVIFSAIARGGRRRRRSRVYWGGGPWMGGGWGGGGGFGAGGSGFGGGGFGGFGGGGGFSGGGSGGRF